MLLFPLCCTGKRGVLKRPWSEAERAAVEEHLTQNINDLRVPAKADCERCLQQCPLLVNNHRDWRAVKFYCHNRIQLLKKNQRRDSQPQPLTVCWERNRGVSGCLVQGSISDGTHTNPRDSPSSAEALQERGFCWLFPLLWFRIFKLCGPGPDSCWRDTLWNSITALMTSCLGSCIWKSLPF